MLSSCPGIPNHRTPRTRCVGGECGSTCSPRDQVTQQLRPKGLLDTDSRKFLEVNGVSSTEFLLAASRIRAMAEVTRRRVGRPAQSFVPKQLNVRVHPKVADAAKKAAAERGLKENQYLAALIAKDTGDVELKDLAALLNQGALCEDSDDDSAELTDQEVLPFSA